MINFQDVRLSRGPRTLFEHASFILHRGEKLGLTGANGTGKTSLLQVIRGELQVDAGEVSVPPGLRIASVAQETDPSPRSALDFTLDGDVELRATERAIQAADAAHDGERLAAFHARYEAAGGYSAASRAAQLLDGVGFATADLTRPVADFSGGWRMRLNLTQALMCPSDLLLLDEPTNHLDLDAILWLEDWLGAYPGTLVLISHDREFLDRVVTRVAHIERESVRLYAGNYSQFEAQRAAELSVQQAMYERQQREIRHVMQFVERFRAKASKARQAQSRLKLLERMERIAPAHVDSQFTFEFLAPEKLPRPLVALEEQGAGYAEKNVLDPVSLSLAPGDRVAILGRNGAGKSTLTRLIAGELEGRGGRRVEAPDLRVGYFAQHQLEQLDTRSTAFEHVRRLGGPAFERAPEQAVRDLLAGFGFRGDRVFEPVAPFSGGEKARLVLALLVARRPNLLLLDEPTNHLDLEMRLALGMALQDYTGALVVVSHDRHLIRSIADDLWLVHDGKLGPFAGDLDDYADWLATNRIQGTSPTSRAGVQPAEARRVQKRVEAERRNRLGPLRARVRALEEEIARLGAQKIAVESALAEPGLYASDARDYLREQLDLQRRINKTLAETESQWVSASEALESADREP